MLEQDQIQLTAQRGRSESEGVATEGAGTEEAAGGLEGPPYI